MPMTQSLTGLSTQKKTSPSSKMTSMILLIGAIQIKWLSILINARLWGYLRELMWLGQLLLTLNMASPWVLFKITSILVLWFPSSWSDYHVKSITSRASRLLGFIRRLVRCNDPKILVNLSHYFMPSHSWVWDPCMAAISKWLHWPLVSLHPGGVSV